MNVPSCHVSHVVFHWSGGKDSALALSRLIARDDVVVDRLVTTIHAERDESSIHGIPVELLRAQADAIGIGFEAIPLPGPGLEGYDEAIRAVATRFREEGIEAFAFGDLSCSGGLEARQAQLGPLGLDVIEPLWGMSSTECIEEFLSSGHRAVVIVVDAGVLAAGHVGALLDRTFVDGLPEGCDRCGEFGEYHSFAYDGPLFDRPVEFALSSTRYVEREIRTTDGTKTYGYWQTDPRALSASGCS